MNRNIVLSLIERSTTGVIYYNFSKVSDSINDIILYYYNNYHPSLEGIKLMKRAILFDEGSWSITWDGEIIIHEDGVVNYNCIKIRDPSDVTCIM